MKITVIAVGKIKEKYFTMGIEEYAKRLKRYCKLEIIEVSDEKTPDKASKTEETLIKKTEGERILRHIKEDSYIIALAIEGKMMGSVELADKINMLGMNGTSHITFIIGGSLGLYEEILKKSHLKLSFSLMTFPHQMMRMILLEQIYRAYRIISGAPYHK